MNKIKFNARGWDACTSKMAELCNDGRCWTIIEVFGMVTATAYDNERQVPRTPASTDSETQTKFWKLGRWHERRKPTAAMERKQQAAADKAGGVSDGGNDRAAYKAFWRRRKAKNKQG